MQQKTQRPVQFEITERTRESLEAWIEARGPKAADFLFPGRIHTSPHLSTRQYARLVHRWVASTGLDDTAYGTHTMRSTKASLICRRTKNLRAVQLLLDTQSWKARFATWESRSTMPSRWRSRPRFDGMAAGEQSLAGQYLTLTRENSGTADRLLYYRTRPLTLAQFVERCQACHNPYRDNDLPSPPRSVRRNYQYFSTRRRPSWLRQRDRASHIASN